MGGIGEQREGGEEKRRDGKQSKEGRGRGGERKKEEVKEWYTI